MICSNLNDKSRKSSWKKRRRKKRSRRTKGMKRNHISDLNWKLFEMYMMFAKISVKWLIICCAVRGQLVARQPSSPWPPDFRPVFLDVRGDQVPKDWDSTIICDHTLNVNMELSLLCTVAYLGHGEKTNYSANPPGRNTNPPGRNSQSARAE